MLQAMLAPQTLATPHTAPQGTRVLAGSLAKEMAPGNYSKDALGFPKHGRKQTSRTTASAKASNQSREWKIRINLACRDAMRVLHM